MEQNFWEDKPRAEKVLKEKKLYEDLVNSYESSLKQFNELSDLYDLALEENNQSILKETENNIVQLHKNIKNNEIKCFLSKESDSLDCYLEIHAGAGGTESQDWAQAHGIALVSDVSLPELAALLEKCSLYVGNDSGPAHIADAIGIDTVTIFGSSVPGETGPGAQHAPPAGLHSAVSAAFECAPCRERFFEDCPSPPSKDGRPPCLESVSVDDVLHQVNRSLDASHA